jgi:deltex-like protein
MVVTRDRFLTCDGHSPGSLVITYRFFGGTQQSYHPNPGERFFPTSRVAYVPYTKEGIRLVSRLQDAFRHGLTFAVGTSLTTGRSNMICWQSIHHKTNLACGAHGFPDNNYFRNCNEALDALNVKPAGSDEMLESAF